jgi:hypothetical protein
MMDLAVWGGDRSRDFRDGPLVDWYAWSAVGDMQVRILDRVHGLHLRSFAQAFLSFGWKA